MTAYLDTNVLVRYFTGDPTEQAQRAAAYLSRTNDLLLPDLIFAEVMYVLESFYGFSRTQIVEDLSSLIVSRMVVVTDDLVLLRALEVYEAFRVDFPDAYVVALAERSDSGVVVSFDRDFDRISSINREEPA